jgi:hypothetical protein
MMATLRIFVAGERAGPKFQRAAQGKAKLITAAMQSAAEEAGTTIETLGTLDIASAPGKWGTRWTTGLHAKVSRGGGNIRIDVTHDVPYFLVFEEGRVIRGKPMLWIPLSFASDAKGVWARDFPGRLFRVDRVGKAPLLLSAEDKQPKYFGKEQVRIPQKFHIRKIARDVMRNFAATYKAQLQAQKAATA